MTVTPPLNPRPRRASSFSPSCGLRPGLLRTAAWLCIATQGLFPVATGAAAVVHTAQAAEATRVYTLGPLESAQSVANRYGLTLDELKKLNQLRTFARGLENVRQGDELDVPAGSASFPSSHPAPAAGLSADNAPGTDARAAGLVSQAGGLLSQGLSGKQATAMASGMARGQVTGAANSALAEWLNGYGTARVGIQTDEKFSLKGSSLDVLLPWYETQGHLLFSQHSFHRSDDRNQLNTGLGWRHFSAESMQGVNLFWDHDLSRYHSRMGLGVEYGRDYLKLAGNSYVRLTNWRSAPELNHDYEARPANGWDVRAEGWLPAYPQIGGQLVYEQYYGDEVALFGKDKRQKDPHALTAGVNWTPFPLLTVSADHRQGKGSAHDTRLGVGLSWQPGVSLSRQLDPGEVAFRRSVAGSRHDLVSRNNNIVLEYRKKELVKLQLHDPVTGKGAEEKGLIASLQTKYPLKGMTVEAESLVAAGGSVRTTGQQVLVTLPAYRYTATATDAAQPEDSVASQNTYRVAVTAEDTKGNRSERGQTTVVVSASPVSPDTSQFIAEPETLTANGADESILSLTAQDAQGNAISGLVSAGLTLTLSSEAVGDVTLSAVTESEDTAGLYKATLKAGTTAGDVTITPELNGDKVAGPVTVTLTEPGPKLMEGKINSNGESFPTNREPRFPVNGFEGADFTFNEDNFVDGGGVSGYTLTASCGGSNSGCDWVQVDEKGTVTFRQAPQDGQTEVTITATPSNGTATRYYTFKVENWFTTPMHQATQPNARSFCDELEKRRLPEIDELTTGTLRQGLAVWDEFGTIPHTSGTNSAAWSSTEARIYGVEFYYIIRDSTGEIGGQHMTNLNDVVCVIDY